LGVLIRPQDLTQDASMSHSNPQLPHAAIPLPAEQLAVLLPLCPLLGQLAGLLLDFRAHPVSPKATQDLELALTGLTRTLGRQALETTLNSLEPDRPEQVPAEVRLQGICYRRRPKSPTSVDSTFGTLQLRR